MSSPTHQVTLGSTAPNAQSGLRTAIAHFDRIMTDIEEPLFHELTEKDVMNDMSLPILHKFAELLAKESPQDRDKGRTVNAHQQCVVGLRVLVPNYQRHQSPTNISPTSTPPHHEHHHVPNPGAPDNQLSSLTHAPTT